jgi:hypothetical protein
MKKKVIAAVMKTGCELELRGPVTTEDRPINGKTTPFTLCQIFTSHKGHMPPVINMAINYSHCSHTAFVLKGKESLTSPFVNSYKLHVFIRALPLSLTKATCSFICPFSVNSYNENKFATTLDIGVG